MKRWIIGLTIVMTSSAASKVSHAGFILVSYTVSGTPGNYDLNFSVTNNMTTWHQNLYLFGVSLIGFDVAGSPPPFGSLGATTLNFAFYGGSNSQYNTNWRVVPPLNGLLPGNTLSGFIAHDTDPGRADRGVVVRLLANRGGVCDRCHRRSRQGLSRGRSGILLDPHRDAIVGGHNPPPPAPPVPSCCSTIVTTCGCGPSPSC